MKIRIAVILLVLWPVLASTAPSKSVSHNHEGRAHSHPLPKTGVNHGHKMRQTKATSSTVVRSFNVNGIYYGMGKQNALEVLRVRSEDLITSIPNVYNAFIDAAMSESVVFCRGLVVKYQFTIKGGLAAFVRAVEKETMTKGEGSYDVSSEETTVGEWLNISFTWNYGNFKKEVFFSSVAGKGSGKAYSRYAGSSDCE